MRTGARTCNSGETVIVHGPFPGRLNRIVFDEEIVFAFVTASSNEPDPWLFVLATTKSASAEFNERPAASSNVQMRGEFIVGVGYCYLRVGGQAGIGESNCLSGISIKGARVEPEPISVIIRLSESAAIKAEAPP